MGLTVFNIRQLFTSYRQFGIQRGHYKFYWHATSILDGVFNRGKTTRQKVGMVLGGRLDWLQLFLKIHWNPQPASP